MSNWESVGEWLHQHPSRMIVISAAGRFDEEGRWKPRQGRSTFVLTQRLPDGRKVQSSVEIIDEVMCEPMAGDMIVHNAKMAIATLLHKEQGKDKGNE